MNKSNFPWNMPVQKLSAQNNGWTKKKVRYSEEASWFPELAGLELSILVKRHLLISVTSFGQLRSAELTGN